MVDKMYNFLIRSIQVFIRLFSPVYTSHYVLSLFVIVMWLYSLSFKPITQNPYILGPTHVGGGPTYELM